jgi:hypothetical protein
VIRIIERVSIVLCGVFMGFAYTAPLGLATLIALDTLLDIRYAIEGNKK